MLSVELWPQFLKGFSTLNDDPVAVVGVWYMAPEYSASPTAAWSRATVHKSPTDLCSYNFQICKEKEIGSKAAVVHFLHASLWCCLLCESFFRFYLHLSVVTSSCSSSAELSAGVFHGAIDPGALLSGCILPSARALQWCCLAQREGKGANRSIYLEAGGRSLPRVAEPGWELAAHQLLSAKVLWYNLKFLLLVTQA